jgi:hypothetical protein
MFSGRDLCFKCSPYVAPLFPPIPEPSPSTFVLSSLRSYFDRSDEDDFSLGAEFLEMMLGDKHGMSAKACLETPLCWKMLQMAVVHPAVVRLSWLSLLAVRGCIVFNKETKAGGIVIYTSAYGILFLKVNCRRKAGLNWVEFDLDADGSPKVEIVYDVVVDVTTWTSRNIRPVAPCQREKAEGSFNGVRLEILEGESQALLGVAALTAFKTLTVPQMQLLIRELKIANPAPRPTLEKDVAQFLVAYVFPEKRKDHIFL